MHNAATATLPASGTAAHLPLNGPSALTGRKGRVTRTGAGWHTPAGRRATQDLLAGATAVKVSAGSMQDRGSSGKHGPTGKEPCRTVAAAEIASQDQGSS